ncbi:MAG: NUDIX domain-containing protein [Janthinobacterium lividum]
MRLPPAVQTIMPRLIHASARFTRPLTLGVRAVLLREGPNGTEVFLVRHSYVPGWHLPGGAVEAGETIGDAMAREVREECAITVSGTPELFGIYYNRNASRRDHVAVFRVRTFEVLGQREADLEIIGAEFYPVDRLPASTSSATRLRLAEILDGKAVSAHW